LDVRPEDILNGGHFRKCNTYRGGGGYDRFPYICEKRIGVQAEDQFVVQLKGCHLKCPYCYVTPEGIWGKNNQAVYYTTEQLVDAYIESGQRIFHLMGGAPALWINYWPELIDTLFERCPDAIFHSDLTLTERRYNLRILKKIVRPRCLYAVSIKGTDALEYSVNTGIDYRIALAHEKLMWDNLTKIAKNLDPKYFYFTYTGCKDTGVYSFEKTYLMSLAKLWSTHYMKFLKDSFKIDLVQYDALLGVKGDDKNG
jgi:hypothetical protein